MIIQKKFPQFSTKKPSNNSEAQIHKKGLHTQNDFPNAITRVSMTNQSRRLVISTNLIRKRLQFEEHESQSTASDLSSESSVSEVYSQSRTSSSDEVTGTQSCEKIQEINNNGRSVARVFRHAIKLEAHTDTSLGAQQQKPSVKGHFYQIQQHQPKQTKSTSSISFSNLSHNNIETKFKVSTKSSSNMTSADDGTLISASNLNEQENSESILRKRGQRKRRRVLVKRDIKYKHTNLVSKFETTDESKSILKRRLEEFNITMMSCELMDRLYDIIDDDDDSVVDFWNLTFLPGNRMALPPQPPPLMTSGNIVRVNTTFRLRSEDLRHLPQTPSVYIDSFKDAHSSKLREFCLSQPVAIIRNLASILQLDLGAFSTKMLVSSNPTHKIEQRIQDLQAPDENRDQSGATVLRCHSSKNVTTIQDYANYQARTFVEARQEDKLLSPGSASSFLSSTGGNQFTRNDLSDDIKANNINYGDDKKKKRKIFFGTNCDLSNESKWFSQLQELNKLPDFLKVVSPSNLLCHCGFTIMGMNSVQLYMKVPGCRTPGHQENNNFISININIGPGDCEWFSVTEQYWGAINSLCEEHEIDYLSGSWWPNLDDLKKRQIPVYRFIQKPGDLVWINAGTVHWVQAIGWCNNVAWNVGPFVSRQYSLAMERYEFNKLRMYKSIVPMIHLSWQIAKNVKITESDLYQLIRYTLMVSIMQCTMIWDFLEKTQVSMLYQPREEKELTQYCEDCECEVFNIFLIKPSRAGISSKRSSKYATYETRCLNCALKINRNLTPFKSLYQYKLTELGDIYDSFKLQSQEC